MKEEQLNHKGEVMEEKKVEVKGEEKAAAMPKTPVARLELLSVVMMRKVVQYGKSNVARFIFNCSQSIATDLKAIKEVLKETDEIILEQHGRIETIEKTKAKQAAEISRIKASRLWPLYRRLTGNAA